MDLIIRFLLLGVLSVAAQNDIQEILNGVFGTPPPLPDTNATCIQKNGGEGICMAYHLCRDTISNKTINIQVHNECFRYMDICCPIIEEDVQTIPDADFIYDEEDVSCGKHNPNGMGSVDDDNSTTKFAEFPWIVAVLEEKQLELGKYANVYLGAGSIIHPQVVLTVAHILKGTTSIRAGEWDSMSRIEPLDHQDIGVEEIVVHERYTPKKQNMHYDVALLILSSPLILTVHVGVVCLPPLWAPRTPAETRCLTTGWGKNSFQGGHYQNKLKKTELPVVNRRYCEKILRGTRLGLHYKLHRSFMCAGGEANKDACTGDGGAPLFCPIPGQNDRYVQNGIVSWGIDCGIEDLPGVYTDVTFLRSWIDSQMAARNFNPSSYTY